MTCHLGATRRHLPYGITQCYLPPDTSELTRWHCHHLTTLPAPARNMKGTLMKFNSEVVPLSDEGLADVDTYHSCLRTLHSQAVVEAKTIIVYQTESLELLHPISHHSEVCCLGQSVPLVLPSCVLVTVDS